MPARPTVWDNHACIPLEPQACLAALPQLVRFRQAGVDVISVNAGYGGMPVERSIALLDRIADWVETQAPDMRILRCADDIASARAANQLGIVFDIEGIGIEPDQFDRFEELAWHGVRWISLAYNRSNALAGGCHDRDSGLSDHGRQAIDRMQKAGITVCCSHVGHRTAQEIIEYSSGPVIFSHSNMAALCGHPRNATDALLVKCAERGGLVGLNGVNAFLGVDRPTVARLADHIEHAVSLIGWDHVSLALDSYTGGILRDEILANSNLFPAGQSYDEIAILGPECLVELATELKGRGMDEPAIAAIFGENLVRFARQNWPKSRAPV